MSWRAGSLIFGGLVKPLPPPGMRVSWLFLPCFLVHWFTAVNTRGTGGGNGIIPRSRWNHHPNRICWPGGSSKLPINYDLQAVYPQRPPHQPRSYRFLPEDQLRSWVQNQILQIGKSDEKRTQSLRSLSKFSVLFSSPSCCLLLVPGGKHITFQGHQGT